MSEEFKTFLRWFPPTALWLVAAICFWDAFLSSKAGLDPTYVKMAVGIDSIWILWPALILAYELTFRGSWKLYAGGVALLYAVGAAMFMPPFNSLGNGFTALFILIGVLALAVPLTVIGVIDFFVSKKRSGTG